MTLTKKHTALLNAALQAQPNLLYWLHQETTIIANNEYIAIKNLFQTWEAEYNTASLYGTNGDGSTFQYTGIDQFPIPPTR